MAVRLSALRAGRPLPPGRFLVLISVKRLSRPQGHSAAGRITSIEKDPMTSGLEPATFQHVALCLNQPRYRVIHSVNVTDEISPTLVCLR
jgi:hypothetical protein